MSNEGLSKRRTQLPVKPKDLNRWILINRAKLKAQMEALKAAGKLGLEEACTARLAALTQTQDLAEELLYAEAQLGAALKAGGRRTSPIRSSDGTRLSGKKALPEGITWKHSHEAQKLYRGRKTIPLVVKKRRAEGNIPLKTHVIREIERAEQKARIAAIRAKQAKQAEGVFDVIVIDPPWPMQKIERECRPNQAEMDYPTMSETELRELSLPMADICHVWLWTTHRFLPLAFELLKHWELKYICTFVWHKPGGFQPVGLPQYNCEFALYARRGAAEFTDTKALPVCFVAKRGGHTVKPDEFYDMVRRVTAGRRLDWGGRRKIDGFEAHGKEAPE